MRCEYKSLILHIEATDVLPSGSTFLGLGYSQETSSRFSHKKPAPGEMQRMCFEEELPFLTG